MSYKCYNIEFNRVKNGGGEYNYPFIHMVDIENGATFKPYKIDYINWNNVNYIIIEKLLNIETGSKQEYLYINFGDYELNMDVSYLNEIISDNSIIEVGETVGRRRIFVNKTNLHVMSLLEDDNYYYEKNKNKYYLKEYRFDFKNQKDSLQVLSKTVICL